MVTHQSLDFDEFKVNIANANAIIMECFRVIFLRMVL